MKFAVEYETLFLVRFLDSSQFEIRLNPIFVYTSVNYLYPA